MPGRQLRGSALPPGARASVSVIDFARFRPKARPSSSAFRFPIFDLWSRKLFTALLRRYDLKPYRYRGQRRATVMVRVQKIFSDETLWPEFCELNRTLRSYLDEVTERVIREEIFNDSSEADEENAPSRLPADSPHESAEAAPV